MHCPELRYVTPRQVIVRYSEQFSAWFVDVEADDAFRDDEVGDGGWIFASERGAHRYAKRILQEGRAPANILGYPMAREYFGDDWPEGWNT